MSARTTKRQHTGFVHTAAGQVVLRLNNADAAALDALEASNSADFGALARAAGLDPMTDFIGRDLSGLPLGASNSDLRGFVFRGADLTGTGVINAIIDDTTDFTDARLDAADVEAIRNRFPGPFPPSFDMLEVHRMVLRGQAPPKEWLPWIRNLDFSPVELGGVDLPGKEKLADLAPLASLTGLQQLYLTNTQVSDLAPLGGLIELQTLNLRYTQVNDLAPLGRLTGLRRLYLSDTQVSDLAPLAGLTGLRRLYLQNTEVSDLAQLGGLTGLRNLGLDNTQFSDLAPLASLTGLQTLYLDNTQVSDLAPLAGLKDLQTLYLNNTQVSDLAPLAGLTVLRRLYIANTQVSDLAPLAGLTGLRTLYLTNTQVSDLAPLAGLTGLQRLYLDNTQVNDLVPLVGFTALRALDLGNTQVSDLAPLRDLPNLAHVQVESLGRARKLARTLAKSGVLTTKNPWQRWPRPIRPLKQRARQKAGPPPGGA